MWLTATETLVSSRLMKTDDSPSEAEKREQKAEGSTNTNGKQRERRAFLKKRPRGGVCLSGRLRFLDLDFSASLFD